MAGNAWTQRRGTIRRPPVCRAKPQADSDVAWPNPVLVLPFWQLMNGLDVSRYSGFEIGADNGGTGFIYYAAFADDQGHACELTFFNAQSPSQAYILISILAGPYAGNGFTGFNDGWTGTNPFNSQTADLTSSSPDGGGTWSWRTNA